VDSLGGALHLHLSDSYHMNEPMHQKNKQGFGMQTKAPYDDGASKRGGYISSQIRMHACHLTSKHYIYFLFVAGKILNVVQQDWGPKKKESLS